MLTIIRSKFLCIFFTQATRIAQITATNISTVRKNTSNNNVACQSIRKRLFVLGHAWKSPACAYQCPINITNRALAINWSQIVLYWISTIDSVITVSECGRNDHSIQYSITSVPHAIRTIQWSCAIAQEAGFWSAKKLLCKQLNQL